MARIRTVKPDFFRHEGLHMLERACSLPIRVAYSGLWTVADREGRFAWRPRVLKLDVLPFDDVDFEDVLDALWSEGFIVKYEKDGEFYGCIPTWNEHQNINKHEAQSRIPDPSMCNECARTEMHMHARGEGKGKEGNRKGNIPPPIDPPPNGADDEPKSANLEADFVAWYHEYPNKVGRGQALRAYRKARKCVDAETLLNGLESYKRQKPPNHEWKHPATWLNGECWQDQYAEMPEGTAPVLDFDRIRELANASD